MHPNSGRLLLCCAPLFLLAATVPGIALAQIDTTGNPNDTTVNLKGVTVSGDRDTVKAAPERVDVNSTETKDIITKTKIEQLGTTTDFLFTLDDLPNSVVWDGGGNTISGAKIVMNGFDQTRINFQLDGIPINDPGSYSFYSYQYAQNDIIKSIVVTPGAGNASVVGLSAIGGNIAINTDNADPDFYLQPRLGAGSYNKYEQAGKISSGTFLQAYAPTSFYVAGTHTTSQSFFENNSGSRDNLAFKSNTSLLGGTLTTFFDLNNQAYSYNEGCTLSAIQSSGQSCNFYNNTSGSDNNTIFNYNSFRNWIAYADYSLPIGKATVDEKFYYYFANGYGAEGNDVYLTSTAKSRSLVFEPSYERSYQWGDILKADIPLPYGLTLQPGLWFQLDQSRHYENVESPTSSQQLQNPVYYEFVSTTTATPYFNLNFKPIEHLIVDVGAKYLILNRDYNAPTMAQVAGQTPTQKTAEYYSSDFRNLLPSIGANYEFLSGWHAYANYTRNARPPGYSEFYEVSGNFSLEAGLKPEKTNNYMAGVYFNKGPFEGRISAFDTHYQDYILNLSVATPGGGSGYVTQVANVGSAHYTGGALALTYLITPWLQGFANIGVEKTWLDRFGSGPASYAPNQTQSAGLFANYHGFSSTVSVDHAGQRAELYINTDEGVNSFNYLTLKSLTTVNASVGYDWKTHAPILKELDTHLALRNLTNSRLPVDYNVGFANDYNPENPLRVLNTPFSVFLTIDAKLF